MAKGQGLFAFGHLLFQNNNYYQVMANPAEPLVIRANCQRQRANVFLILLFHVFYNMDYGLSCFTSSVCLLF